MAEVTVDVRGSRELQRKFQRLGSGLRGPVLRRAATAGVRVIRDLAREEAPHRSGDLRREIKDEVLEVKGGRASAAAGFTRDAFYGLFVHEGTGQRTHRSGKSVGSMPADPFLTRAFDRGKDKAVEAAGRVFRAEIERLADG